jgi:hypothetical protein
MGKCPKCKSMKHPSKYNLKLNPLKHYLGTSPLWLCYPNEYMTSRYRDINWDSVKLAEMIATAWNGIEP